MRASWPVDRDVSAKTEDARPGTKHLPQDLLDRWADGLKRWNAPSAGTDALHRLKQSETAVVVTGQQPGFWGGPLFSMYKAATAVVLAERLSRSLGIPVVPVFWVQGEDTDWDEVGWGALPGRDLSLTRHRWKRSPVAPRSWIGSASVDPPAEMREPFAAWGDEDSVFDLSRSEETDLSTHFIGILLHLFGARGLLPLDGRWPETRGAGGDLWSAYHARHAEIAEAVQKQGREISPAGAAPPLDAETSDHGLFILEGETRREIDPASWPSEVARTLEQGDVHRLAPSVLLRAVLQDHLFGTAAHVVGTVEGAYLRQLEPVYRALGVEAPVRVPRLHAIAAPGGLLPAEDPRNVLQDPEGWIGELAASRVPEAARAELAALEKEVSERLQRMVEASPEGRKDLDQLTASAVRKIQAQLGRLDEALVRREKQTLYREDPRLRHLPEFLRPRRGPQERGLSAAAAEFLFGPETAEVMLRAAGDHLDCLELGELHHLLLESPRE